MVAMKYKDLLFLSGLVLIEVCSAQNTRQGNTTHLQENNCIQTNPCETQLLTFNDSKAGSIALHFETFEIPEGASLIVKDMTEMYHIGYTTQNTPFWSLALPGDTIYVEYVPPSSTDCDPNSKVNVHLDRFEMTSSNKIRKQDVCGRDTSKNAVCFSDKQANSTTTSRRLTKLWHQFGLDPKINLFDPLNKKRGRKNLPPNTKVYTPNSQIFPPMTQSLPPDTPILPVQVPSVPSSTPNAPVTPVTVPVSTTTMKPPTTPSTPVLTTTPSTPSAALVTSAPVPPSTPSPPAATSLKPPTETNTTNTSSTVDPKDLSTLYLKSKAVMRLTKTVNQRLNYCTAWLWGNQGHILTNHHCISSQELLSTTVFEFMWECSGCEENCQNPKPQDVLNVGDVTYLTSDKKADFALLQISNTEHANSLIEKYGFLQIASSKPSLGQQIYIPQHPQGGVKKISVTDDDEDEQIATILSDAYEAEGVLDHETQEQIETDLMISYAVDTLEGSSGAPVIRRSDHVVVGLHKLGIACDEEDSNGALRSDILAEKLTEFGVEKNKGFV